MWVAERAEHTGELIAAQEHVVVTVIQRADFCLVCVRDVMAHAA